MEFGKLSILFIVCIFMLACTLEIAAGAAIYSTSFGKGEWNEEDWIFVKSPRWDYIGSWVQKEDYIENRMPELVEQGKLVPGERSYMSMVLREKVDISEGISISAAMEFEFDQAPQIVLASELGKDGSGYPEYREHFEIVLYARGINIWHHRYADGKPSWILAAYSNFPLEAGEKHLMKVEIQPPHGNSAVKGKTISIRVGEHHLGYHESSLPDELYAGIIGYASKNRFYDFTVEKRY